MIAFCLSRIMSYYDYILMFTDNLILNDFSDEMVYVILMCHFYKLVLK